MAQESGPIRVYLAKDSATVAHSARDCAALLRRPSWGGQPVEVEVSPPGDKSTVSLRAVSGSRDLRLCRKCWA